MKCLLPEHSAAIRHQEIDRVMWKDPLRRTKPAQGSDSCDQAACVIEETEGDAHV